MKFLLPQITLLCSLWSCSTASILMDGPVSLHSQTSLHETVATPASIVYEHDETIFVLRTDQFPIKVFILSGAVGANCSIPMGSMDEVFVIGEGDGVSAGGVYSVAEGPETIHILIYNNIEDQIKLQGYSKETFQKVYDKDLDGRAFSFVSCVDDGLLLYDFAGSSDANLERRSHTGDLVWSIDVAFQNSLSRFTHAVQFGTDYIATGYTRDKDPITGELINKQVFVCRIDSSNGDVSSIQYMTGETAIHFSPLLATSSSCSHFGVVYDASTETNTFDIKLAIYDSDLESIATHDLMDEPLDVEIPFKGGAATAKLGDSGILVAFGVGVFQTAYLAYFDCNDAQTSPEVTTIPIQDANASKLNVNSVQSGAILSIDNIVDPEVRANFIMICPEQMP